MNTTTSTQQNALTLVVEEAVEAKLKAREPFTALDISNTLKARSFPVRHAEVAPIVRDIYASGAMTYYDYDRRLIDVVTDGGTKRTQAFLYLHDETKDRDYAARDQDALPPVPHDQARSLDDAVAAGIATSPLAALRQITPALAALGGRQYGASGSGGRRQRARARRDGALAIPRAWIAKAGWQVGQKFRLVVGATATGFTLEPVQGHADDQPLVRVWSDLRVRVCKTKLRLTAVAPADPLQFDVQNGALCVERSDG